ncbi:hypothetical protein JCM21714_18 [Gracilibacillus boraciitolerans JCM 21714]|uniref:Uncharacterized protein n=1 Tax=Gracilibacillus boraciitolerans JCM 21714 TaxID=1298598 RepID=W4VD05_9BACI|nr:hypothetical protein [Gracilibacillus boraciitolerans]GAE91082.1 hypothetical protein JCM21714_18 [Gracilibacillus boraciitolerans JCM 21714]
MVGEDVFQQGLVRLSTELSERLETGITLEFIKGLLTNLRCICGTTIDQDSIEYRKLDSLADSVKRYEENQELYTLKNELNQLVSYLDGRNEQISQVWNETKQLNSQKDHVQYMLEEINKRLGGQSREHEVKELSQERKHIVTNNVKIDYEKKNNKDEQEEYLEKIKKVLDRIKGTRKNEWVT